MFTGLVEEIGTVVSKKPIGGGYLFQVRASKVLTDMKTGDSINVNGVCQTVTSFDSTVFSFETVEETLQKTNLGTLYSGSRVNLERSLRADSRLGGHFVMGHVDCTAIISAVRKLGASHEVEINYPSEYSALLVPVGSIAVDGISLTLADVKESTFRVAIINQTWHETIISHKQPGDSVNLEFDILGKYIQRALSTVPEKSKITLEWLKELGY